MPQLDSVLFQILNSAFVQYGTYAFIFFLCYWVNKVFINWWLDRKMKLTALKYEAKLREQNASIKSVVNESIIKELIRIHLELKSEEEKFLKTRKILQDQQLENFKQVVEEKKSK